MDDSSFGSVLPGTSACVAGSRFRFVGGVVVVEDASLMEITSILVTLAGGSLLLVVVGLRLLSTGFLFTSVANIGADCTEGVSSLADGTRDAAKLFVVVAVLLDFNTSIGTDVTSAPLLSYMFLVL